MFNGYDDLWLGCLFNAPGHVFLEVSSGNKYVSIGWGG